MTLAITQGIMTLGGGAGGGVDPFFSSVSSLIHFEGANGSTSLVDTITRAWAAFGNAQISTASPLYQSGSGAFDGNGDFWRTTDAAPFRLGNSDDFTIEFAVRFNALTRQIFLGADGGSIYYFDFDRSGGDTMSFAFHGTILTGTTVFATGVRYRVAVSRQGTTIRLFVEGNLEDSEFNNSGTGTNTAFEIGAMPNVGGATFGLNGSLDEFRFTKGVARYTASYTPSDVPFPDS